MLETSSDADHLRKALTNSPLASSNWQTERWDAHMLETVGGGSEVAVGYVPVETFQVEFSKGGV